jgi:hypothetical protein
VLYTHFKRHSSYTKSISFCQAPCSFLALRESFCLFVVIYGTDPAFALTNAAERSFGCIAFYKTNT